MRESLLLATLAALYASTPLAAQEARGWIGVGLECKDCSKRESDDVVVWRFQYPPVITSVQDDGPAARAGLESGDTILRIDGADITSDEGGRRFGGLRVGVAVEVRVRQSGRERTVSVTPGTRSEVYGEHAWVTMYTVDWDSLRDQARALNEQHRRLQQAMREVERVWREKQRELQRRWTEEQSRAAEGLRLRLDSLRDEMVHLHRRLRIQADSMAVRALIYTPRAPSDSVIIWRPPAPVEATVVVPTPAPAARATPAVPPTPTIAVVAPYANAVAGARFEELCEELAEYFPGVEQGLLVLEVVEETPAHTAGLRAGDVVVKANGEEVGTIGQLRRALRGEDPAELEIVRKGMRETLQMPRR